MPGLSFKGMRGGQKNIEVVTPVTLFSSQSLNTLEQRRPPPLGTG